MASPINTADYPILFDYSVLAQSGITSGTTTTINNLIYGNTGGDTQIIGTYLGTSFLDSTNALFATAQLDSLVSDINGITNIGTYNGGSATFNPGIKYTSAGTIVPSGTLTFDASGNSNAQFFIVSADPNNIEFIGPITFNLIRGAQAINIFWLANTSGLISLNGDNSTIQGNLISGTQVIIAGNRTINGSIFALDANITFVANTTVNGSIVCYLKGTKILTQNGYVLIEDLKIGDKVVTKGKIHDNSYLQLNDYDSVEPITWIGNFKAPNLNKESLPICIKAHALGENYPIEDLYVSPGHRIIIDCKMVCARDLINGTTIFQDNHHISVHYYHLELSAHASIIASGVLSESYLDFDNHNIFETDENIKEIKTPESSLA